MINNLRLILIRFLKFVTENRSTEPSAVDSKEVHPKKNLEEEYLDYEAKVITRFYIFQC